MSIRALVKTLEEVTVSVGGRNLTLADKVKPVLVPSYIRDWPVCVYARQSGLLDETFRGAALQPGVEVSVLAEKYEEVEAMMQAVIKAITRSDFLYMSIHPPTDSYEEEVNCYRQMIHVVMQQ